MKFLYKDFSRDEHGLLESNCESGDCSHWSKNWSNISTTITTDIVNASQNRNNAATNNGVHTHSKQKEELSISFQRFEYTDTEKYGCKLTECREPITLTFLLSYISECLDNFVSH